jgi:hypothetical protein
MKFIGLAITIHALSMSVSLSGSDGPRMGAVIAGLFLAIGMFYCLYDALPDVRQKAGDNSR